jgi:hypothetical protein
MQMFPICKHHQNPWLVLVYVCHVVLVHNKRTKLIYVGLIMQKMLLHTTGVGLKFHTQRKHTSASISSWYILTVTCLIYQTINKPLNWENGCARYSQQYKTTSYCMPLRKVSWLNCMYDTICYNYQKELTVWTALCCANLLYFFTNIVLFLDMGILFYLTECTSI